MFMKKILAAGMAVVGMVGMASAVDSPVNTKSVLGSSAPQGTMEVSYTQAYEASMVVTSRSLKNQALLNDFTAQANYGNLGEVVVKTNYPLWDVEVKAKNKLILSTGGEEKCTPATAFDPEDCQMVGANPLLANGTKKALIAVNVGIVNQTGGVGLFTATNAPLTTVLSTDGKASFAVAIGTTIGSGNPSPASIGFEAVTDADDITNNGFGMQSDPSTGVMFYITGGLVADDALTTPLTEIKGKNTNGDYTETLTFTLLAGF